MQPGRNPYLWAPQVPINNQPFGGLKVVSNIEKSVVCFQYFPLERCLSACGLFLCFFPLEKLLLTS